MSSCDVTSKLDLWC